MAADDTVSGGTASVEIEAVIVVNEQSLAEAKAKFAQVTDSDVSTPEGRRSRPGRPSGSTPSTTVNAEAKVKTKLEGTISKDIQAAIDKDEYQLTIDTASIRKQIQRALQEPFEITVNAKVVGVAEHGGFEPTTSAAASVQASRPMPPEDVLKALTPILRQNIDSLYRNISQAFSAAGKGRFGHQSLEPGNEIEKATELIGQFGDKFSDMLQVKGPVNKAVGGSLSPQELGKALGLDPKHEALRGMTTAALGLTTTTKEGGLSSRGVDVFFARLKKWTTETPVMTQAAPPMATAAAYTAPIPVVNDTAAKQQAVAAREEAEATTKEIRAERQRSLTFSKYNATGLGQITPYIGRRPGKDPHSAFIGPTIPGTEYPGISTVGGRFDETTTGEDLAADERARQQLGSDRANQRRSRKRVPGQHVAGLGLDLEPFLRLAEMGQFQDVFEQFGGKGFNESQGFGQLQAKDVGGYAALQQLRGAKPGVKRYIAGQEGKFTALRPSEAFARTVLSATGADTDNATMEAVRSFLESPAVADSIKKAIGRGSNPLSGAAGATKRGQGGVKIGTGPSDLGAQSKRLFEFIDYLDGQIKATSASLEAVDRSIDELQGSGRPTTGLDKRAADLVSRGRKLQKQRAEAVKERDEIGAGGATDIMRAAAAARGQAAGGQSDVQKQGIGLTVAERALSDKGIFGPGQTGQRQAAMAAAGELPSQQAIVNALVDRYYANQDRPEGKTGYQTLKQAAFGPTGKARRAKGDEDTGLYGELTGALPGDLGPTAKREAQQYIQSALSSVISDQGFKRSLAEGDIKRKEPMAGPLGRTRSIGFTAGFSDLIDPASGSFRKNVTGEGLYRGFAPGTEGRIRGMIARNRGIDAGTTPRPPAESEYPYSDPDQMQAELDSIKQKFEISAAAQTKAQATRERTRGRTMAVPGDVGRDIARESGVFMEEEIRHAPFERFNDEHSGPVPGVGPGYERIAASTGAAGARGGGGSGEGGGGWSGEVSGPIHVIVDNTPLLVAIEGGGGGRGGGRAPRGRVPDEQPEQPADTTPRAATPPRAKPIRYNRRGAPIIDIVGGGTGINARQKVYSAFPDEPPERQRPTPTRTGDSPLVSGVADLFDRETARERFRVRQERAQRAKDRLASPTVSADRRTIEQVEAAKTERILSPTDPAVIQARVTANVAQQRLQSRSLGTSFVSLAESLVPGRRAALARVGELRDAGARQNQLLNQRENLEQRLGEANFGRVSTANTITDRRRQGLADDPELVAKHKIYRESVVGLTNATKDNAKALGAVTGEMDALANGAVGVTDVLSNLGAGFVGGIGGGLVVGAVGQASQLVVKGLQETLGPIVDRLSGNVSGTGRVQGELATGLVANNSRLGVTLAQAAAGARLSDQQLAAISGPLGARTQTVAGTQSLQAQQDLLNTSIAAGQQTRGGFDRALTRSTGGLFDIQLPYSPIATLSDLSIGGQASTAETLAGSLRNIPPAKLQEINPSIGDNLGIGDSLAARRTKAQDDFTKQLKDNTTQLSSLNANLKGSQFQLVAGSTDQAALQAQQDQFGRGGAASLGQALKDAKVIVTGLAKTGDDIADVGAFLKQYASGPKPSAQVALAQDQPAIQAQIAVEDLQRRFQLQTVNPQTFAIGEAANPLQPAAAGINTTGLTAKGQKEVNAQLKDTQKLYDGINADVAKGLGDAKSFVSDTLGGDAGKSFADSLDRVASLGKEIAGIQVGVETKQAAYSAAQYSYQINLAKRSLTDAKGLTGEITKQNGDNLGIIERQTFLIQRQGQALGLQLSQKQINFQRAIAGFQSPGLTSEEREARKNEAKLEADYAQKQLNIQKQLFSLGGRQFKVSGSRQVRDLGRQLDLLEKGRTISVETAVAEKRILALSKVQAKENKQVETYYNAAVQRTGDVQAEIGKLVAATETDLVTVGNLVLKQFKSTYDGFIGVLEGSAATSGRQQDPAIPHAAGFLGSVNGATSLGKWGVAGEAAGEAVAIVKDPQKLVSPMGGSSGGGNTVQVNIYNPIVKSDDDRRKLIVDVKRAIQQDARLLLPGRA